jgi:hypothetical protein
MSKFAHRTRLSLLAAGALLMLPAVASAYQYEPTSGQRRHGTDNYFTSTCSSYCGSRGTVVYDDRGAHYLGSGRYYYSSCGCYRGYYTGYRHRGYGPDLYDYSAQVYDDRQHLDRRTPYEYRWPSRPR